MSRKIIMPVLLFIFSISQFEIVHAQEAKRVLTPVINLLLSKDVINGCDEGSAVDLTGSNQITIAFSQNSFTYSPACVKVSPDTTVIFSAVTGGFENHPLRGGRVVGSQKIVDATSPILPTDSDPDNRVQFLLSGNGPYGFYCDVHGLGGMRGAIFVAL